MQYVGGKHSIRKLVVDALLQAWPSARRVVDPFCGGLHITAELARRGIAVDASDAKQSLISLYRGVAEGWIPPENVSRDSYLAAKSLPQEDPMHGFCEFGVSFGGKSWGGYTERLAGPSARAVVRDVRLVIAAGGSFRCIDYRQSPEGLTYADPPYAGTTGYSTGHFDHAAFWTWAEGRDALVSEETAPAHWRRLVEISKRGTLNRNASTPRTEVVWSATARPCASPAPC